MATYHQISNTIWNIANHLRGAWKAHEYQDVILPLTVLRRLDAALEPTKQKALERYNELDGKVSDFRILRRVTGYDFYNISPFTFKKLLDDQTHIARNLRKYVDGFSPNIKEIFEKFDFERQLERLQGSNILYLILQEFDKIDLHPERVPNHVIGLAFEDLIRRFAEQSNETAGEHYTPRDVVGLMTALIFMGEEKELAKPGKVITLYDPACGTGGMLTVGSDYVKANFNPDTKVYLFGQELNSVTYAICKADILLQNEDKDPEGIRGGEKEHDKASTLSNDQHQDKKFDYILSNPPYGVEWKKDKDAVENEARRGFTGRFGAGLPRISDGQFLFLQHIVSKFKAKSDGGSKAAVIFNGSPLFTGDAGSGESEIRRWLLENDLVDAIISLPEKLFFNTGISTYIWLLTNQKEPKRKEKVLLIDARSFREQLRRNLGQKRYEISSQETKKIIDLYCKYEENEYCKIYPTQEFGYRQITIDRPLRLKFEINDKTIGRFKKNKTLVNDSPSKKLGEKRDLENKKWKDLRKTIYQSLDSLQNKSFTSRSSFLSALDIEWGKSKVKVPKSLIRIILNEIGERDERAEIVMNDSGNPEPDKDLRDYEYISLAKDLRDHERVPLKENIKKYFDLEVKANAPDAWINNEICDDKDGQVGIVGYLIPLLHYYYKFEAPRKPEEVKGDLKKLARIIPAGINDILNL